MTDSATTLQRQATFIDLHPPTDDLVAEALAGLTARVKTLPCKLLYDAAGAELFERICDTADYYVTRVERALFARRLPEMTALIGPAVQLIEFGCGCGEKTRALLGALEAPASCVLIDIARDQLRACADAIAGDHPEIDVIALCADYLRPLEVPHDDRARRRVAFFPGSTIGNFRRPAAARFLRNTSRLVGPGGGLLIGVDLVKPPAVLERAYDDDEGVTAAFDRNLLARLNREADADFDLDAFVHRAVWNERSRRVEMRLVSRRDQVVHVAGVPIFVAGGEAITTEHAHKWTVDGFQRFAAAHGFAPRCAWTDARRWFSVHWLEAV